MAGEGKSISFLEVAEKTWEWSFKVVREVVGGAVVADVETLVLARWMCFLVHQQVVLERKLQSTFALDWLAAQLLRDYRQL